MIAVTDWCDIGIRALKLVIASILALRMARDRERSDRGAGFCTFPLVAIAGCGVAMIAPQVLKCQDAQARLIERLMTGVRFIGGGAILKPGRETRGPATSASFRATGAVGAAIGYRLYGIAIVISVATFLVLRFTGPFERPSVQPGPGKAIGTGSCRSPI